MVEPATLEALACHEFLALAKDLMLQQIKITLDCKLVTDINKGTLGPISSVIMEISRTMINFGT